MRDRFGESSVQPLADEPALRPHDDVEDLEPVVLEHRDLSGARVAGEADDLLRCQRRAGSPARRPPASARRRPTELASCTRAIVSAARWSFASVAPKWFRASSPRGEDCRRCPRAAARRGRAPGRSLPNGTRASPAAPRPRASRVPPPARRARRRRPRRAVRARSRRRTRRPRRRPSLDALTAPHHQPAPRSSGLGRADDDDPIAAQERRRRRLGGRTRLPGRCRRPWSRRGAWPRAAGGRRPRRPRRPIRRRPAPRPAPGRRRRRRSVARPGRRSSAPTAMAASSCADTTRSASMRRSCHNVTYSRLGRAHHRPALRARGSSPAARRRCSPRRGRSTR